MASGSVCPPGKCVCNSCGLEIVDKYLLKVGRNLLKVERPKGSVVILGALGKDKSLFLPSFPFEFSLKVLGFLRKTVRSRATHEVGKRGGRNLKIFRVAKDLVCTALWFGNADNPGWMYSSQPPTCRGKEVGKETLLSF